MTLFSVNSFSQTTHTFTVDGNPLEHEQDTTVLVGDVIEFKNGNTTPLYYSVDGEPVGNIIPVNGTIFTKTIGLSDVGTFTIVVFGNSTYQKTLNVTVVESTAGIADNTVNYNVYPNPTTAFINVDGVDVKSVKVFDMTGKLVVSDTTNKVNVSELPNGYYTLVVNETSSVKFIKN